VCTWRRSISATGVVLVAGVECLADAGYATKVKTWLLVVQDRKDRPKLVHPGWPVKVKIGVVLDDPDVIFMVLVVDREEKGFDFNVATHLLTDVCEQSPTRLW
jgi:hypothetical protein